MNLAIRKRITGQTYARIEFLDIDRENWKKDQGHQRRDFAEIEECGVMSYEHAKSVLEYIMGKYLE